MSPQVVAAIVAASVSFLTLIGTLAAQYFGRRATSRDTEKTLEQQRERLDRTIAEQRAQLDRTIAEQRAQLDRTIAEQREQLDTTLAEQRERLDITLAEQRTRTLNERFTTAAGQLGSDKPSAVRLAGVYAMAGLADDWLENQQTCVDVLCAYLRMPYEPDPGEEASDPERLAFRASREVRHTVIRVITAHLKADADKVSVARFRGEAVRSWHGLNFDFWGVVFDGGDFRGAKFSGGTLDFAGAEFSGGTVYFDDAEFSGGTVNFRNAKFSGGMVRWVGNMGPSSPPEFCGSTVDFDGAEFSGGMVDFDGAEFSGGRVHFRDAAFSGGTVDFSSTSDWSFPPDFPWTGTPPPGVKLPTKEDQSQP
jgi:uncharacterized protein YjbI with pentapeptide repeats